MKLAEIAKSRVRNTRDYLSIRFFTYRNLHMFMSHGFLNCTAESFVVLYSWDSKKRCFCGTPSQSPHLYRVIIFSFCWHYLVYWWTSSKSRWAIWASAWTQRLRIQHWVSWELDSRDSTDRYSCNLKHHLRARIRSKSSSDVHFVDILLSGERHHN